MTSVPRSPAPVRVREHERRGFGGMSDRDKKLERQKPEQQKPELNDLDKRVLAAIKDLQEYHGRPVTKQEIVEYLNGN